ncbi:carbonic anhydrase [Halodesulfovibrio marinisediminis]|uniref:Carbonic anhydrase n=1 Tax=Halodesulfovibrio marinisediminis DSM 17456 TaxID=1121457 RepID=A0A1N6IIZ7_9BACT|nr:carbonic anhydrase [Halodesulfovibrio marinisediminis]SIO31965.1 carbonic anhydrase [Halodesulfovibrio marinisediminis DSM 17456]
MRDRTPESALKALQEGNQRFVANESGHPRSSYEQTIMAKALDQTYHAIATFVACSDSRMPVERIFDVGIMDAFVVRTAGNVIGVDQAGSIEYGVGVVATPLLVFLGHTKCGAVQTTIDKLYGKADELTPSINAIIAKIRPAVLNVLNREEDLNGQSVLDASVEQNIWQGLHDLFMKSKLVRDKYANGGVKIIGGMYDVETGVVRWLDEKNVSNVYASVQLELENE